MPDVMFELKITSNVFVRPARRCVSIRRRVPPGMNTSMLTVVGKPGVTGANTSLRYCWRSASQNCSGSSPSPGTMMVAVMSRRAIACVPVVVASSVASKSWFGTSFADRVPPIGSRGSS